MKVLSSVKWTEDQQKAIDIRYRNTLVSAAAGSGKTAVLVERIINIITDEDNPVDIDKLLIVTFTNAAAAEMRERIGEAINKKIKENPNNRNLQTQLILLNKASISTLHSFCLNLIKNNFHQIDVEPSFRVGDTTELNLLKLEALEDLMEAKYNEDSEAFLQLVESYCDNKTDRALAEIVLKLYNFAMSMASPEIWLKAKAEAFNLGEDFSFEDFSFKDEFIKELREEILIALELNNQAMDIIVSNEDLEKLTSIFEADGDLLERTFEVIENGLKEGTEIISGAAFGRFPSLKLSGEAGALKEKVKGIRDEYKDIYKPVQDRIKAITDPKTIEQIKGLYPLMAELSNLVLEFKDAFDKKKRERGIIDFNDQEHYALEILRDKEDISKPSNVALELKEKFEEILVDEYQDSNNVQEEIINLICRKEQGRRNVFMVGDLKQSIYRFRMAKPELFKEKKNTYTKDGDDLNALITLHKNFRSREEVIDGINFIFKAVMSEEVGELAYDEGEELKVGAAYKEFNEIGNAGGAVEFNIIDLDEEVPSGEEEAVEEHKIKGEVISSEGIGEEESSEEEQTKEELDAIQVEARFVAKRIRQLMEVEGENSLKVYDKHLDDYRRATYKDMIILLRSSNKLAPIFIEEFKKEGIPLFSEGGGGYFDTLEIKTIISTLEIIDNPIQDIPLIAVLRSPIGGFTTDDLADIRISNKEVSFYHAMVGMIQNKEKNGEVALDASVYGGNKDLSNENIAAEGNSKYRADNEGLILKIKDFLDKIERWRLESRYTPINKLIWQIITDTGYYGYVGALPGGEQRQANLKILFKRAKDFERTSYKGLYSFINFINNVKSSSEDMGSAKIIGENEDVVRIMSIHKSKGLEFPIVFLCGLNKRFNEGDLKGKILFHQELGYGPTFIDLDNRVSHNTAQREFISKKIQSENKSEEMRLLYVALTRAKEKLILVGSSKGLGKKIEKWAGADLENEISIKTKFTKKQTSYMDWIGAAVMNHRDGEPLRHFNEEKVIKPKLIKDNSAFKVNIFKKEEFMASDAVHHEGMSIEEKLEILENMDSKGQYDELLKERLNYQYEFEKATKMPTVISVTQLKEAHNKAEDANKAVKAKSGEDETAADYFEDEYIASTYGEGSEDAARKVVSKLMQTPLFLQEKKGLSSAEIGTAYHNVMQRINLQEEVTRESIKKQINSMVEKELMTFEAAKEVSVTKIFNFFNSDIGEKVIEAYRLGNLKRELPFRVEIPSTRIYENLDKEKYENEKLLLRGVIDCYFDDGEEGIIIDYKTDYAPEDKIEEIKERYKVQLDYYSEAVKDAFKKKKVRRYLYLFSSNKFVEVE